MYTLFKDIQKESGSIIPSSVFHHDVSLQRGAAFGTIVTHRTRKLRCLATLKLQMTSQMLLMFVRPSTTTQVLCYLHNKTRINQSLFFTLKPSPHQYLGRPTLIALSSRLILLDIIYLKIKGLTKVLILVLCWNKRDLKKVLKAQQFN